LSRTPVCLQAVEGARVQDFGLTLSSYPAHMPACVCAPHAEGRQSPFQGSVRPQL
jgi:hypothetical protein